jgi:chloride channel protein, CIC family
MAAYGGRFWALVVLLGVTTGVAATVLIKLLHLVERLAYGSSEHYLYAVKTTPGWRHFVVLMLAALIVIVAARVLGNMRRSGSTEVSESLWLSQGRMAFWPSVSRSVVTIVTVGMGVSLGREGAPQLTGAATASRLAEWAGLPIWQRRLLVASGAGAGVAAVYNVPLGGTLLALEVLLGTLALPLVVPALLCCGIATAVGWIAFGNVPTFYTPIYTVHASQLVWAAILGPLIGILAVGWARLIERASNIRLSGAGRYLVPVLVLGALALLSIPYPQLLGNGSDIVQLLIVGNLSIGLLVALCLLKPLATAGCIGSGSPGGLFMPTFAVGSLFASLAGTAFVHIWHGAATDSYALIGGGAFLAAAMQGPLAGIVLVLELTRHFDALIVPTMIAVAEATTVARLLGAHSIYSARLKTDPDLAIAPTASAAAVATLHVLNEGQLPPEMMGPPPESR